MPARYVRTGSLFRENAVAWVGPPACGEGWPSTRRPTDLTRGYGVGARLGVAASPGTVDRPLRLEGAHQLSQSPPRPAEELASLRGMFQQERLVDQLDREPERRDRARQLVGGGGRDAALIRARRRARTR